MRKRTSGECEERTKKEQVRQRSSRLEDQDQRRYSFDFNDEFPFMSISTIEHVQKYEIISKIVFRGEISA